jgi:hypothetical protein
MGNKVVVDAQGNIVYQSDKPLQLRMGGKVVVDAQGNIVYQQK